MWFQQAWKKHITETDFFTTKARRHGGNKTVDYTELVKTTITLPDALVRKAERAARKIGMSRNQFLGPRDLRNILSDASKIKLRGNSIESILKKNPNLIPDCNVHSWNRFGMQIKSLAVDYDVEPEARN